jgi:outer membrane protein assembly factor BamB
VIGSPALGQANGADAVFVTSAIFGPFSGTGLPAANPDTSVAGDPARVASVHALDAASGRLLWHASVSTPAYAPATYASGIVFAPLTTGFGVYAYDADTGVPLWRVPIAAAASSGVSIAGTQVFFGGGTTEGTLPAIGPAPATGLPPQVFGIWSLTTALAGA